MGEYDFLGKGLGFPLKTDLATGRCRISEGEDNIRQSIVILLSTKQGERVMRPEFGCRIWEYLFSVPDASVREQMRRAVSEALILWEPRIRDIDVSVRTGSSGTESVIIEIGYVIRATNNPYNMVFPFFMNEGMRQ